MSNEIDRLFGNFRPTAFQQDPNEVPQQIPGGSGNIAPVGWLQDNSVTSDVIQTGAVIAGKIAANAVTATTIAAGSVTAAKIAAGTITSNEIAAGTITATNIAAGTITSNEIAADTILANNIAANAITSSELATNSVTTAKITALNVTTGKIEVTLTGHNYSANSTNGTGPGIYFDAANTTGLGRLSGGAMWIGTGISISGAGGTYTSILQLDSSASVVWSGSDFRPILDNSYNLGSATRRWITVYAVNGTINTSDAALKTDIADAPLGLSFLKRLVPRVFRWKNTPDTQAQEAAEAGHDAEAMAAEMAAPSADLEKAKRDFRSGKISEASCRRRSDAAAKQIEEIRQRYAAPFAEARAKTRPGRRLHYGLIAQEVKQALDAAGVDSMDAGFWQESPEGVQGLNYSQFVPILIGAVQELAARVEELESKQS